MITLLVIAAGLVALFVYTLATLSGMTPKRLYPLLRVKQTDGRITPLVIVMHLRDRTRHATTLCPYNS
ncbi:MAG: hypothetical protein EPO61_15425 [Nitrospirae bacterium]|nr:MAG: hypothetical protein EPO61_15425 [Nitrospirota bacterium]